ncbi:MAG TPA: hypothetical protein VND64_29535 [Pirellulales bacterium]|nr:hypothetical protein [Pirellulales bacterium]
MPKLPLNRDHDALSPQPSTDERPAGRLARWPCELVLGLLVLLCLAFDVQAAPLMWVFEEGWWGAGGYIVVGAVLAQPALLGAWAVLGPQRAAIQWPRALLLLVLVWWADTLGERAGWDPRPKVVFFDMTAASTYKIKAEDACLTAGVFLGLFLLAQVPLFVARCVWRWRVSRPVTRSHDARRQFSLRHLFGWTTLVALLLAASRYLLRHQTWQSIDGPWLPQLRELAYDLGCVTRALLPILLPSVPLAGLVLGQRRRVVFLIATFVCAVCGAVTSVALIADQNASVRLRDGCFEELGFCGATLAVLWVVRACGFRLSPFSAKANPLCRP